MATPLRVLILEDMPDDAELMFHQLRQVGLDPVWQRVETETDYCDALGQRASAWQVILADYTLPQFDALRALRLLRERGLDIPFIVVTGSVSEEVAVECMKQGASDYLLKDRLARLGPAVRHAVAQRQVQEERRRAEATLFEREAQYRALFNYIPDPVFIFDKQSHRFLDANEAVFRIYGYSLDELRSMTPFDLHPPEEQDKVARTINIRNIDQPFTYTHLTRQGRRIDVEVLSNEFDYQGRPASISIVRDITERKRHEEQLVAAREKAEGMTRLTDAFLTNMSHEIRTPLTAILGFADLLVDEVPGAQREAVTFIQEGGRRLLETLNAVLDLACLEAGGAELTVEPVDVRPVLGQVAGLFRPLAEKKALGFKMDLPPAPVFVPANRAGLERILNNLLLNAFKFTEAGWVAVRVYADEASGYIVVEDTGIGMEEAFLPHLFDAFIQESTGLTRDHEGTGLGMAIAKRLVEAMGGQITVQSKKGHGARFTLCFPRVPPPLQADGHVEPRGQALLTPTTATPPTRRLPLRILVAEDNLVNQKVVLRLLERLGCTAAVVANGREALQALERAAYDVILMDVQMPEMDGLEATRQICARYGAAQRPRIIAVTANAMEGDRERCLDAGMDDYLSKPVRLEELGAALRQCLPLGAAPSANGARRNPSLRRGKRLSIPVCGRPPKDPHQENLPRRRRASS